MSRRSPSPSDLSRTKTDTNKKAIRYIRLDLLETCLDEKGGNFSSRTNFPSNTIAVNGNDSNNPAEASHILIKLSAQCIMFGIQIRMPTNKRYFKQSPYLPCLLGSALPPALSSFHLLVLLLPRQIHIPRELRQSLPIHLNLAMDISKLQPLLILVAVATFVLITRAQM